MRTRSVIEDQMRAAEIRKAACIIAVKCRRVIQTCLRDEEVHSADEEFQRIAEQVIRELHDHTGKA